MAQATGGAALQEKPWTAERVQRELPEVLTIEDLSPVVRKGQKWIRDQLRQGQFPIPHDRWGRGYRFLKKDVLAYLNGELK